MKKLKKKVTVGTVRDNVPGTRKTCRHIKVKKNEDFVYGDVKVTSYKMEGTRLLTSFESKLKNTKEEKQNPDKSFSDRNKEDTKRTLKRKSRSVNRESDIAAINKKGKLERETFSNRKTSSKLDTKEPGKKAVIRNKQVIKQNKAGPVKKITQDNNNQVKETVSDISGGKTRTRSARQVKRKVSDDFETYEPVETKDSTKKSKRTPSPINNNESKFHHADMDNCDKATTTGDLDKQERNNTAVSDLDDKQDKYSTVVSDLSAEVNENIEYEDESEHDEMCKVDVDDMMADKIPYTHTNNITCLYCNLLFTSKGEYISHIRETHKSLSLCEICSMCFETKIALQEHLKESHGQFNVRPVKSKTKIYKCTYDGCSKEFTKEISCQKHISRTHLIKKYSCEFCETDFKNPGLLRRHLKLTHEKETSDLFEEKAKSPVVYKCDFEGCDKEFTHKSNRKKHRDCVHLNIRNYHCEFCGHTFKTSNALKCHIEALHTKDTDKKQYECDVCKKTFYRKTGLELHQTLHTNIKSFVCSFEGCGKAFRLKTTLAKHEKVHSDDKPHHCQLCDEKFSRKTYLDSHMYKHTGEKNYKCDICQKTFSQKGNMVTHKLLHNRDRTIYKCPECSQTFNFKSNMKKHLLRHAAEESIIDKRGGDDVGENRTGGDSSQSGTNDLMKVSTTGNEIIMNYTGKKEAPKPHKILIAPNLLGSIQKSTKPIVFVVNPIKTHKGKIQDKNFEPVNISTINIAKLSEVKRNDTKNISPLKLADHMSVSSLTIESSRQRNSVSTCGKVGAGNDQQCGAPVQYDIQSLSKTNESEKGESFTSQPLYVSIEEITHEDSIGSIKDQGVASTGVDKKSEEKIIRLIGNNPTFTIELNSDGLPVARIQGTGHSVSSDMNNQNLSYSEDSTNPVEAAEQTVTDIMKEPNNTFEEGINQIGISEQILKENIEGSSSTDDEPRNNHVLEQVESNMTKRQNNLPVECSLQTETSDHIVRDIMNGSNKSEEESAAEIHVLEQIMNIMKQVTNDTNDVVETTVVELTEESSKELMDTAGNHSFHCPQ